jgi:hypothetical protein
MKIGKTIIQWYAGLSMLLTALAFLVVLGLGSIGLTFLYGTGVGLEAFLGLGMAIIGIVALIQLYISWGLFKFKDWARKVWLLFAVIGLLMSFSLWSLVINGFLGYLMFVDKDTERAFK